MNLNDKTYSFSLCKTSPKISGNIKITIDSTGQIWLNSFDATKELSSSDFKKFRLSETGIYESDLRKFIGSLPPEIVFNAKENMTDPENISRSFEDQFDFFYNMGAENLVSKSYDEEYSYLAPIWLRENLPEHFVIFRVDEPLDFPYNKNVPSGSLAIGKQFILKGDVNFTVKYGTVSYSNNQIFSTDSNIGTNYIITNGIGKVILLDENKELPINTIEQFKSLVKRAHVIKTFDLTENSSIGKYIRNIVNGKFFPSAPLTVRFENGLMTTWNGISYQDGIMSSKGEFLQDFYSKGHLQIDFEDYITSGFQRHGIICPFLLNLEFLFNDTDTPIYSIPRYFGFYVNKVEFAQIQLDGDSLYQNRETSGNTPAPKRPNRGYRQQSEDFFQTNENGVRLFYTNEISTSPSIPLFVPSSDTFNDINFENRFYWIQDKKGNFYSLDQTGNTTYNTDPSLKKDLVVRNKSINLGDFAGPGSVKLQDKGKKLLDKGRAYMVIKINEQLFPNDKFNLYWNLGFYTDVNGNFHTLTANDLSKRPFTVPANGTTLTITGMDITSQYEIGQTIQINYGNGNSVLKVLVSVPMYSFGNTILVIDSPIDATTTSATTPIIPGWGPGSAMLSLDNGTIYYHPFGTNHEIASAVAKAFNLIEDKTFDAVSIDDQVVIRMREGESIPNNFFLTGNFTLTNEVFFQTSQFVPGQKFYFEGGTDTSHIRLKFPLTALDKLKEGESFLKTKRGLSKIKFIGRYVDEAINQIGSSELGDLNGFNEFGALYIEDNLDEPVVTTIGEFIVYGLYEIPIGLFSIFNLKEIDGDFFSSTYGRSPLAEVYRYFDIPANIQNVLVEGRKYLVKSDSSTDSIQYLGNTIVASSVGTIFTAGIVDNEIDATGDGVNSTFSFSLKYTPAKPGTIVITDSVETFIDNGVGYLTGTLGGTGDINYVTGEVMITFFNVVTLSQNITSNYHLNYSEKFTILNGTPIVVAQIFHSQHINPSELLSITNLDSTHTYMVFGDPTESIKIPKATLPFFLQKQASFIGTLITGVNSYISNVGNPLVIDITKMEIDSDLKAFPGFWTFKDIVDVTDQTDTSTIVFNNREKFIHHDINSEYDYLKENFSKEESVKSRIVPTISKWVYQGGDDVRDNPYRLNVNPVFGSMSFSPSFIVKNQDTESFTHEWPYLEQAPHQYPSGLLKDNYYFFYNRIDMSKIQDANPATRDYFTDYFTFLPIENTPDQERYNIFSYNSEIGICEAFFRGVKVRIKEVVKDTKITELKTNKPPYKDQSTRFKDYKFSVILRPFKQDPTKIEAPVSFNISENRTHKTILLTIDVIIEDYRTLSFLNPENLGTYGSPLNPYPDMLDVSIDYLSLYSFKSKKTEKISNDSASILDIGLDGYDFGDVKLSFGIAPELPSGLIPNFTVVNIRDNPDYDWDSFDEIKNFNKENILLGSSVYGDAKFPYPLNVNAIQILFGLVGNFYPQDPLNPYPDFENPIGNSIPIPYGSSFVWKNKPFTQLHAGLSYFEPIMQRISFARIADKINSYSPFIKYKTYVWDELTGTTKVNNDEFYLELIEPSIVSKVETLLPQVDEDKPEELKDQSIIGVTYANVNYFHELYRYSGAYEPKFRNILFFKDQPTDQIVGPNIDISFKQATFNPNIEGFGILKNLGYLKVANKDVLSLVNNPKYKPRYPLLNEIPVDFQDFFTFKSNWDPGFWRTNTTKKDFVYQAGTREMKEVKNFLGTKIMKTHPSVRLQDWTIEPKIASLDQINIDNFNGEIIYSVVAGKIQAYINIKKRLLRFLIADGADSEFNKYLMSEFGIGDPESLSDDVIAYLTLNVLPTYEVKLVDLYIRKYQQNLGLDLIRGDMTDAQKLQNQYLLDKNFTVQKKADFVYYFEYTLDNSFKVSLAPSVTIGKI